MDNDTPSSSAAAVAMDVVDALRQSSSHVGGHFDDEELRRYFIASPQSQSGEQAAMTSMGMMNMNSSNSHASCAFQPSPAHSQSSGGPSSAAAPPSNALETAVAALGDQGRQQLLAILQMAAGGNQQSRTGSHGAFGANAPFATTFNNAPSSASSAYVPGQPTGQMSAHTQVSSSSSSNSPSNGEGSNSSSNGRTDSNAAAAAIVAAQVNSLPNFYSNAFKRYSAHSSPQQQQQQQQGSSMVNPSQHSHNASTPNSNSNSSAKPSPALSAVTSHSQHMPSNGTYNALSQQVMHQQSGSHPQHGQSYSQQTYASSAGPSNMNFALPDANFFRSPATFGGQGGIPGTSSTAFYSENGNSEDIDLLFTPLMSPALTASTQPGPSVGPLPESFANMSTHSQQQKYPDHTNGSQGVAPMTVFSPLTSPALRPQGHSQPLPTQLNQNVASPPKVQGSNGNGKIRGASKNGSKTRPSPIIRPTVDTEGYSSRQSVNTNGKLANRASSSTTSGSTKRTSQQSQSAVQSPVSATGFTSFPPFQSRQQSTSVPASPAFYAAGSNASTSSIGNGNTKPFSNLNMSRLQENIAQTAVQNSPSPHQFDISGVLPAFIGMPQPPAGYAPHTSDRPSSHTPSSQTSNKPAQQNSLPSAGSLDEMMALPSPLDLNNILNMLGPNTGAAPNSVGHQSSGLPSTTFTFPGNGTQLGAPPITGLSPFDALLLHNYQQQQQHEQLIQSSFAQQHNANGSQQSVAQNNTLAIGQPQKAAPLTPASFMNLPANQYSVLSGLLADHQHPSPQLPANGTDTSRNDTVLDEYRDTKTSFGLHESSGDKKKPSSSAKYESDAVMPSKQAMKQNVLPLATSEEMHSSIALNATSPVSPALLAQNIKQVAAAAIAAKDAKSRSKAKGPSKRRSSNAAQRGESSLEQINDGKRNAKKENTNNANTLNSPEKPFHLDDGPSAAISMHGGSGPASTETSPMLSAQPDSRKSSHKVAEQRRRDSLKLCFEELRFILPPINPDEDEDYNGGPGSRRPGENNVGGQRGKNYTVDPHHPNKGISKVAMLRKSNEYVTKLHDRIDRRDAAISMLREELRLCRVALGQGVPGDEAGLDALSNVDFEELEQDSDPVPPTYRLHGLHAPGSKLSLSAAIRIYQPTERTIAEDDREDDDEGDGDCMDDGEYKAKKVKRSSGARVNTRNTKVTGV